MGAAPQRGHGAAAADLDRENETMLAPQLAASATHERFKQPADVDSRPEVAPPLRDTEKYIGTTIDGRYLVESVIGEGGMGVVYRCHRKIFEKTVAVKILRAEVARTPEVLERFVTEAKAASAIGNAHIVDVLDFGEVPDGSTYFAMEYLEGQTLGEVIASKTLPGSGRVVTIGRQIAEGLAAAHDSRIVHRDLKPDNVFIIQKEGEDFVKILDFGIAKVAGLQNKITRAGAVFGTPHYMSPEQCRGTAVDNRTDIYALGVILYEMVVGHVPFDAENPLSILSMHLNEPPVRFADHDPPIEAPAGLENVILKCMAKVPDDRFQSMREVEYALSAIARGEEIEIEVPISVAPPPGEEELPAGFGEVPSAPGVPFSGERLSQQVPVSQGPSSDPYAAPADSLRASFVSDVRASHPNLVQAPASVRTADQFEAELKAAAEVAEAEREWAATSGGPRRWPLIMLAAVAIAGVVGFGIFSATQQVAPLGEAIQAARPAILGQHIEAKTKVETKKVALVLSPIDAHVHLGNRDLGKMPVAVPVPEGGKVEVEVKRDGYWTRKVTLDGYRDSVTIRLAPVVAGRRAPRQASTAAGAASAAGAAPAPAAAPAAETAVKKADPPPKPTPVEAPAN